MVIYVFVSGRVQYLYALLLTVNDCRRLVFLYLAHWSPEDISLSETLGTDENGVSLMSTLKQI